MTADLKMKMAAPVVLQDKSKYLPGSLRIVIKGAIHQFDLGHAPFHEQTQVLFDAGHGIGTHGLIKGAHAEGTAIGAAPTGFQIDETTVQVDQPQLQRRGNVVQVRQ